MALTQEDLLAIAQIVKAETEPLREDVVGLKTDIAELKTDVTGLKADVAGLKIDVAELKIDVAGLKVDVAQLQTDVKRLNANVARVEVDHGKKLDALYDAHVDTMRNAGDIRQLDARVESHDHRIFALEQKAAVGG